MREKREFGDAMTSSEKVAEKVTMVATVEERNTNFRVGGFIGGMGVYEE